MLKKIDLIFDKLFDFDQLRILNVRKAYELAIIFSSPIVVYPFSTVEAQSLGKWPSWSAD